MAIWQTPLNQRMQEIRTNIKLTGFFLTINNFKCLNYNIKLVDKILAEVILKKFTPIIFSFLSNFFSSTAFYDVL